MVQGTNFTFLGYKITADSDCSLEINRCLPLGRKVMTNLLTYMTYMTNSILKNRDIILLTKVCLVKVMVFPVVMYGCECSYKESWPQRNICFWTVLLEETLEYPWTARRSNQSILKEISPEYSLDWLMLKLKLKYFGHLMQRTDSFDKTLMLGNMKVGG